MASPVPKYVKGQICELPMEQHMRYAGDFLSCLVMVVGLSRFVHGSLVWQDQIGADGQDMYRLWISMLCNFLPLGLLPIQACGLVAYQRARFWHSRLTHHGQLVLACWRVYSGTWIHDEVQFVRSIATMWLCQLSLGCWEMGNGCPRTPVLIRIAPITVVFAAAYAAVVNHGARREPWRLHITVAITIVFVIALHQFTGAIRNTLIELKDSKAMIQHQRDVYLGLLEEATDGWCSFEELNEQGPHFTEVSSKLRNLFGVASITVPVSHVIATADLQQILRLAHAECKGEEEPEVIIVTCMSLCGCPSIGNGSMEFEVRVFPFRPPGGRVSFCFQLASEKRKLGFDGTPGIEHAGSPGRQVDPVQQNPNSLQQEKTANCTKIAEDDYEESSLACGISEYSPFHPSDLQSLAYSTSAISSDFRTNACLPLVGVGETRPTLSAEIGVQAGGSLPPRIPRGLDTKTSKFSHGRVNKTRHRQFQIILDVGKCALPNFQETPTETMTTMIHDIIDNCNVRGTGCCYWHIGLGKLMRVIRDLSRRQCAKEYKPISGWQCNDCFTMNDDESVESSGFICSFCGNEQSSASLAKEDDTTKKKTSRDDRHFLLSACDADDEWNGYDTEQCAT